LLRKKSFSGKRKSLCLEKFFFKKKKKPLPRKKFSGKRKTRRKIRKMPTYEYECKSCGYVFEAFQRMSDSPLTDCPQCGKEIRRLINGGSGIIFKGSGFYVTDKNGAGGRSSAGPVSKPAGESSGDSAAAVPPAGSTPAGSTPASSTPAGSAPANSTPASSAGASSGGGLEKKAAS
jgi:putative FmdB family regulatory protein